MSSRRQEQLNALGQVALQAAKNPNALPPPSNPDVQKGEQIVEKVITHYVANHNPTMVTFLVIMIVSVFALIVTGCLAIWRASLPAPDNSDATSHSIYVAAIVTAGLVVLSAIVYWVARGIVRGAAHAIVEPMAKVVNTVLDAAQTYAAQNQSATAMA